MEKTTRIETKGNGERGMKIQVKRELKLQFNNTKLEKRVLQIILSDVKENQYEGTYIEQINARLSEIMHGCQTGIVSELITYNQTSSWFNRYKKEIITMLDNAISEGLFETKEGYDNNDNYINYIMLGDEKIKVNNNRVNHKTFNTYEKNILAWYSFEEVSHRILTYIEDKI